MNSQEMMEDYDRLARLCEAKDAALIKERELCTEYIEQRNEAQAQIAEKDAAYEQFKETTFKSLDYANEEISDLEAQITMMFEAMKPFLQVVETTQGRIATERLSFANWHDLIKSANATSETVASWRAKETEPLRREVAMLRDAVNKYLHPHNLSPMPNRLESHTVLMTAMNDTNGTSLAYEREVKAKALEYAATELDARHLESLQMCILPSTMVREIAAELRAAPQPEIDK